MVEPVSVIILVACFAIGVFLLVKAFKERIYGVAASTWPTTQAIVLHSDIVEEQSRNATGKVAVGFQVKVEYEYHVNGQLLSSNRVTFGNPVFPYMEASNYKEQFKEGNQVPVYYNPDNPAEAILAPRSIVGLLSPIPGIFLVAIAVILALVTFLFPG